MTRLEDTIKRFADLNNKSFMSSSNRNITDKLEQLFEFKISNSYRMLLNDYDYDSFSIAEIDFYGSFDLIKKIQKDNALYMALRKARMIQIGRPYCRSYDHVCIDGNAKRKRGELPLVRVCHECILINDKIKKIHIYSQDLSEMLMSACID